MYGGNIAKKSSRNIILRFELIKSFSFIAIYLCYVLTVVISLQGKLQLFVEGLACILRLCACERYYAFLSLHASRQTREIFLR